MAIRHRWSYIIFSYTRTNVDTGPLRFMLLVLRVWIRLVAQTLLSSNEDPSREGLYVSIRLYI